MDWYNPANWFDNAPKAPEPDAPPSRGFLTESFASPYVSIPYAIGSGLLAASAPNYGTGKLAGGINAGLEFGMGAEKKSYEQAREKRLSEALGKISGATTPVQVNRQGYNAGATNEVDQTRHLSDLQSAPDAPFSLRGPSEMRKTTVEKPLFTPRQQQYLKVLSDSGRPEAALSAMGSQMFKDPAENIVVGRNGALVNKQTGEVVYQSPPTTGSNYQQNYEEAVKVQINDARARQGQEQIDTRLPMPEFYREAGMVAPGAAAASPATPAAAPARPGDPMQVPGLGAVRIDPNMNPQDAQAIRDRLAQVQQPAAPVQGTTLPMAGVSPTGRPRFTAPPQATGDTSRLFADYYKQKKAERWSEQQIREGWSAEKAKMAKERSQATAEGTINARRTPAARQAAENVAHGTAEGSAAGRNESAVTNPADWMRLDPKTNDVENAPADATPSELKAAGFREIKSLKDRERILSSGMGLDLQFQKVQALADEYKKTSAISLKAGQLTGGNIGSNAGAAMEGTARQMIQFMEKELGGVRAAGSAPLLNAASSFLVPNAIDSNELVDLKMQGLQVLVSGLKDAPRRAAFGLGIDPVVKGHVDKYIEMVKAQGAKDRGEPAPARSAAPSPTKETGSPRETAEEVRKRLLGK